MTDFAKAGSQKWLQIVVNRKPELLIDVLRACGAIALSNSVTWQSPLECERFREYSGQLALKRAGITELRKPLDSFWPRRGPVWDAIGVASEGSPVFVEAKAHIAEVASPGTKASASSREMIMRSLFSARQFYAPKSKAEWTIHFYQYANRLAFQYFLRELNGIRSTLVFLYFLNADDMYGPKSQEEWRGASRLIHATLGISEDLPSHGVFDAYLDAHLLDGAI